MDFMQYITQNALQLIPVLYIIGYFLRGTPRIPDWLIPWILLAFGTAGGCATLGLNAEGILQGILVTGATVLGNQLWKQTINRE